MVSIMIKDREHSFQRGNAVLSDFIRLGHAQSYKGIHLIYLDKLFFLVGRALIIFFNSHLYLRIHVTKCIIIMSINVAI